MKIEVAVHQGTIGVGQDEDMTPTVETKTIDLYQKFHEFIAELEHEGYKVRKIVLHTDLYDAIKRSDEYRQTVAYTYDNGEPEYETFLGVEIDAKRLGHESITDFIIYTDRKVFHSDMLDKEFLEDVNVEELLHEANNRIKERDNDDS